MRQSKLKSKKVKDDGCVFCKIIKGDVPSAKIYEDKYTLAFLDIMPVNIGHVLVIPKKHSELLADISKNDLSKMIDLASKVSKILRKKLKAEGVNLFYADGEAAGQEIPHAHIHIIPRYKKDGFGLKFPAQYGKTFDIDKLKQIAKQIKLEP